MGCFKDKDERAIPKLIDPILDGHYKERKNALEKCFKAALKRGFQVFALQNGGWCASSATASETYDTYGRSDACKADGEGGPWANQVYVIIGLYQQQQIQQIRIL